MSNSTLLILIVSFSLLYLYFLKLIKQNKFSNDLLFFLIISIILIFTLTIFYYYFQELKISTIISGLLVINNILMVREIRLIDKKYTIISIPYFIFFLGVFIYLILKLL